MHHVLRRAAVLGATLALAGGLSATAAQAAPAAPATIIGTTVVTPPSPGVAGIYSVPNDNRLADGDHITGERTHFTITKAMEYQDPATSQFGAYGLEGCRFTSLVLPNSARISIYVQYTGAGDLFNVYATHSTTGDCLNGLLGGSTTLIDTNVPLGHTLFLAWTRSTFGVITYTDSDETNGTGGSSTFGGFSLFGFNRGGAGTQSGATTLASPATNPVFVPLGLDVRDLKGWVPFNRLNLTRINSVRVECETSGGGSLLLPAILGPDSFRLSMGQQIG